jgi:hypothetical protein
MARGALLLLVVLLVCTLAAGNELGGVTPLEVEEVSVADQLHAMRGAVHRATWGEVLAFEKGTQSSSRNIGEEAPDPKEAAANKAIHAQLKKMRKSTKKATWAEVQRDEHRGKQPTAKKAPAALNTKTPPSSKQLDADVRMFNHLKKKATKKDPSTLMMMKDLGDSNDEKPAPAIVAPAHKSAPSHQKTAAYAEPVGKKKSLSAKPGFKKMPGTPALKTAAHAAKDASPKLGEVGAPAAAAKPSPVAKPPPHPVGKIKPPPTAKAVTKTAAKQPKAVVEKTAAKADAKAAPKVVAKVVAKQEKAVATKTVNKAVAKTPARDAAVKKTAATADAKAAPVAEAKPDVKPTKTAAKADATVAPKAAPTSVKMPGLKEAFKQIHTQNVLKKEAFKKLPKAVQEKTHPAITAASVITSTNKLNAEMMKKPINVLQAAGKIYTKAANVPVPKAVHTGLPSAAQQKVIAAKKQLAADAVQAKKVAVEEAKAEQEGAQGSPAGCKDCQTAPSPTAKTAPVVSQKSAAKPEVQKPAAKPEAPAAH